MSPPRRKKICHGPLYTHLRRFERLPVALPARYLIKQLLRARHVAERPVPYAAVPTMRRPAVDHLPK